MKIKNLAKMTVAAFSLLASVTLAKAGDIYSIDLVSTSLYGGRVPTKDSPLLAGEKAVIRVRMVNRGWDDPTASGGRTWYFSPKVAFSDEMVKSPSFAPAFGFLLGGKAIYATYLDTVNVSTTYTDIFFEYTVQTGDLALPALYMGKDGDPVTSESVTPEYSLRNSVYWALTNEKSETATLSFAAAEVYDDITKPSDQPGSPNSEPTGDALGLYVKTVDFDENYSDPDNAIWRSVGYNDTDTSNGVQPSITVKGGVAESATTVYVWVEGETKAEPYPRKSATQPNGAEAYDDGYGERLILPVTIAAGSQSQTFLLKGLALDETATVCMSSSKDRIKVTGGFKTTWVSRKINIVQLEPSVTLTLRDLNGDATSELQCSDNYKSYIATLDVKLSTTPTGNIDVDISDDQAVLGQNIVLSTSSDKALNPWESPVTKVSFSAGDANPTKTLFVYALGSSDQIENTAATFTPSSTSAAAGQFTKWNSCKMTLKRASATVKPQDSQSTIDDMELSSDYDLTLVVGGSYNDLRNVGGNWTVKYYFKDATGKILGGKTIKNPYTATAPATVTGGDLTGKLLLTIPSVNISADAASLELWVVSPSGSESDHAVISIPEGPSRGMEAFVVDADTEENLYEIEANEGDVKTFKFKLSEKYNNVAYAFLKPQDDNITNSISCSFYAYDGYKGVTIDSSDKGISRVAKMTMLDGEAIGRFEVVICSSEEYDATKKLDYNSGAVLTVAAANVEPVVREVRYGSTSVAAGGQLSVSLPLNIDSTFRATIYEPGKGDLATFETQWYFDDDPYGGAAGDGWYSTVGDPSKTSMTHKFSSSSTWEVKVRCRDKEMAAEDQWSDEFTFTVSVDDEPAVIITPRTGGYTYYEDQTGLAESAFDVSLIGAPVISAGNDPLKVRLTVQNLGASGLVELSTNLVTFTTRQDGRTGNDALSHSFYFKALNGTIDSGNEGFAITATVENPEVDTLGRKWNPRTMNVFILNRPPVLNKPEERNDSEGKPLVTTTHIGETITIPWAVNDVLADKTNLTVTATTDEGKTWTTNTFTAGTSGKFEVKFNEGGTSKTITITVTDPELDSNSVTLYYTIAASKQLQIAANGPSGGNASIPLSTRYARAKGLGEGHVFVSTNDASCARAEAFNLFWNCGLNNTVLAYGYGYQPGDKDNGSLSGGMDQALSNVGADTKNPPYYEYSPDNGLGSYFYGWIQASTPGEEDYTISVSPEMRGSKKPQSGNLGTIRLPKEKIDGEENYDQAYAEAIFSQEFNRWDNMGDINRDGIPDYIALYDYANGALAEADGQGSELVAVADANADGDYMPTASQLGKSTLIPGAVSGWQTSGQAFTAYYELRGYHEGLNFGMFRPHSDELAYGWISALDLSGNEKRSLLRHALARRDVILDNLYNGTGAFRDYEEEDFRVITNMLATIIRAGTSYHNGMDKPVYFTDDRYESEGVVKPIVITNTVGGVDVVTTNNYWIYEYENTSKDTVTITNLVRTITNIVVTGSSAVTNVFVDNPCNSITLDDINYGEWLSFIQDKPETRADQIAAKAYIDRTWHLYSTTGHWGWTCENRTDPTTDDTDGDGMPDGYEYFIWYDAMIGTDGTNRVVGCRFNLADVDSYDAVITSDDIGDIYNPNIKRSWERADTDNDGIYDLEEFLIGTSPVHWDTDRDGLSDLYEVMYNINPLSADVGQNGEMNSDGDFMAFAHGKEALPAFDPYNYVYTTTDGKKYMLDYDATAEIAAALAVDPDTNSVSVTGAGFEVAAFSGRFIPTTEDTSNLSISLITVSVDPHEEVVNDTVAFYHRQVYDYFGFDPRTAWYKDANGNCSSRFGGVAGMAVNTTAFNAKDEYRLLKYRYIVGLRSYEDDKKNLDAGKTTIQNIVLAGTTNPNANFADKTWGDSETKYSQSQHGADTDGDAVPDGWELYLGINPNRKYTIAKGSNGYDELYYERIDKNNDGSCDGDGLSLAQEYAGTDSCGKYSGCASVYANYPGNEGSSIAGWINKYIPTDPCDSDTDRDGLNDSAEGSNWSGQYTINRWSQDNTDKQTIISQARFFMIYGGPKDNGTTCVKGGGYNPCSIDTDQDGLPDMWEHQYPGILFIDDEIVTEASTGIEDFFVFDPDNGGVPSVAFDDIRAATSALYWRSDNTNRTYHVVMGMDGTDKSDAFTVIGDQTSDKDWDGDGLQNWQEYVIQAMRQFRYDDDKTPLMGRDISAFNKATGTIDEGAWVGDKGFLKLNYSEPISVDQYVALEELGYSNFVNYVKTNRDYLSTHGYFAPPPREWDYANTLGMKYMLPPSIVQSTTHSSTNTILRQVTNTDGKTVWRNVLKSQTQYTQWTEETADYYTSIGKCYFITNSLSEKYGEEKDYDPSKAYDPDSIVRLKDENDNSWFAAVVVTSGGARTNLVAVSRLLEWKGTDVQHYETVMRSPASRYVSTDPRLWDTDEDGMDDFYEMFHGLNPILGNVGTTPEGSDAKDIIRKAYSNCSAWQNGWVGWDNTERPTYDPIRYPWMMGEGQCDADGDGLRNYDESITANLTSPGTYHTDPTPLWMTDWTGACTNFAGTITEVVTNYTGYIVLNEDTGEYEEDIVVETNKTFTATVELSHTPSYTKLFYGNFLGSMWSDSNGDSFYSFEQNEGYDTDNDWRSDAVEMRLTAEPTSDPLDAGDVQRRQSLWFGGSADKGAAISYEPATRNSFGYDFYKQFTVEAWVRPEAPIGAGDQYIVSRASNYAGWDLVNSNSVIRMNFALGIDDSGNLFGEMQDNAETTFRLSAGTATPGKWTHLAASFDGNVFTVYVNGVMVASEPTGLIPANGVIATLQDPQYSGTFPYEKFTYTVVPGVTILGARADGDGAFDVNAAAEAIDWDDIATDFFKGSVSEVRIWDGARSAADIASNYKVRFTSSKVKELRDAIYAQYNSGKRRNTGDLDAELVQHYGFSSLPGATETYFLQMVPAGFGANVLNLVRDPETSNPISDAIKIGWWSAIADNNAIGSVYSSPYVVPWIENTVSHLPRLCGSLADSVFWSENFAGYTPALFQGLDKFEILNSMNPYSLVSALNNDEQQADRKFKRLQNRPGGGATQTDSEVGSSNAAIRNKYLYDSRMCFSGITDLVPLGSAFAKRLSESWDGLGAEDAWAMTTKEGEDDGDKDDTGIPQWARDLGLTTREAYMAALANGLMPDGSYDAKFTREYYFTELAKNGGLMTDENGNGLPDWWETYFGIYGSDANGDEDNDGLSNYQEFFVSFGDYTITTQNPEWSLTNMVARNNGMIILCPTNAHSDASVATVDYFFRPDFTVLADSRVAKNSYIGEMVGDHDFMENWWEYNSSLGYANAAVYDPQLDGDGDGWSNYGEDRAYSWHGGFIPELVDSYYAGSTGNHSDAHPMPSIGIRATYYGTQDVSGKSLIVRTRSGQRIRTDATFVVQGSETSSATGLERYQMIGTYPGSTTVRGTLHPGCIVPGSTTKFEMRRIDAAPVYYWTCATCESYTNYWDYVNWRERHDYSFAGESELGYGKYVGTEAQYRAHAEHHLYANQTVTSTSTAYEIFARTSSDSDGQKGVIVLESSGSDDPTVVGAIDFHTGEYELDFAKVSAEGLSLDGMVIRAAYQYNIGNEWPQTVWVSDPSEGWVREGRNTIEAFLDIDNNGVWSAGEPYGMLKDVDVGWRGTGEPVVIELKDESPIMARTAVSVAGGEGASAASAKVVVRRTAINGVGTLAPVRTLASRTVVGDDRSYLTEADLVTLSNPDLDWTWLSRDAEKAGVAVESATYEIVRVDAFDDASASNQVLGSFTRTFGPSRSVPTVVAPVDGAPVYSAQPTFVFNGDDSMTAYCLQVSNETGAVWTSAARALPGRVPYTVDNGKVYMVTPELYVDTFASTNGSFVVLDGSNYFWRVALMNSKFRGVDDPSCWSDWGAFQMDVGNNNVNPDTQTGYGSVAAAVRYYGPGKVVGIDEGCTNIVVEAYLTPDFTGAPVARARVAATGDLDNANDVTTANCTLKGIEPGVVYLLAYIDLNNNCVRDEWESWGYAARIGEGVQFIYSPAGATVTDGATDMPTVSIFIEDTDVNQNEIPDILELNVATEAVASGADVDADGISDSDEEGDYGTDPFAWDTDGDGMPDGWEAKFGQTDPLAQDDDTVGLKDVMAYAVADLHVAVTTNALGEVDARYVMIPYGVENEFTPHRFYKTFDYNGQLAMGAPAETVANIRSVEVRSVIVVHGGVYDLFGFNPTTANPEATSVDGETAAYGVNTKPFTALDKYLVVRYLESFGLADEVAMNANGTWSAGTLRPGYYDSDANNLPDGWELYMNFASASSTPPAFRITDESHLKNLIDAFAAAGELIRNPYDQYYFYNKAAADGTLPELVAPYDNGFAVANGLANASAEEQEAFWSYAPAGDVMAFVRGEFTTAVDGGVVYVVNPANNVLYATTNFMGQTIVTKATGKVYTDGLDNAGGEFDWGVSTNVVVMHSAVYDFYGYDPTTALPGGETVDAEGNAAAAEGVNTVPFTRLWKMATEGFYLPAVDSLSDLIGKVDAWKTDANGNSLADGYELYLKYAEEKNGVTYTDALIASAAEIGYDPYDEYGLWKSLVATGEIGGTVTNFVAGVVNADLAADKEKYTGDWDEANGVMAYARTTAHVVESGDERYVVVIAGADDPDGVAEGAAKAVLKTATLPSGELVAWGETVDKDVAGMAIGEAEVTLVHKAVYLFYGFEADTARGCINDGTEVAAAEAGEEAVAVAGFGHTAPFTHAWRYFTKEIAHYVDPVAVAYDYEDGNGDGLADGWQLYVGSVDTVAYQYCYDPADEYWFYKRAKETGALTGDLEMVNPYTNAFAIENELVDATAEEQEAFWNKVAPGDWMAYATVSAMMVVTPDGTPYVVMAVTDDLGKVVSTNFYETFTLPNSTNEMYVVGRKHDLTIEDGSYTTMSTNVVLIHSAVYDWFGFDPTTANPRAEERANTRPFSALWKQVTATRYLKGLFDIDWAVNVDAVDSNVNGLPDGWELYVGFAENTVDEVAGLGTSFPLEGVNLDTAHVNFSEGVDTSDPWDMYQIWRSLPSTKGVVKFNNIEAHTYNIADGNLAKDEDFDGLSNYQEFSAGKTYGVKLDAFKPMTNGETLDFFRAAAGSYMGEILNGAEFIEPDAREAMGMGGLHRAGTRTLATGWDFWSTARYSYEAYLAAGDGKFEILEPHPDVKLTLRYAGDGLKPVTVKAYQVNPAYPDRGEELVATWSWSDVSFSGGVAEFSIDSFSGTDAADASEGDNQFDWYYEQKTGRWKFSPALKQGKVRFVVAIDGTDISGEAESVVGWSGVDATVTLGTPNKALRDLREIAAASSNTNDTSVVQLVGVVRTKVNGEAVEPRGVALYKFWNNVARAVDIAYEYATVWGGSFTGLDRYLSQDYEGELDQIEDVTYEFVRLPADQVRDLEADMFIASVYNLNSYAGNNEELTVSYSLKRDKANVRVFADSLEDSSRISVSVPKESFANMRYWVEFDGTPYGGEGGFLLERDTDGVLMLDLMDDVGVPAAHMTLGEHTVRVLLGNDKYGWSDEDGEWSDEASFKVNKAQSFNGSIAVTVKHPVEDALDGTLKIAVYEKADLAKPFKVVEGELGAEVAVDGLRAGGEYYVAAWLVKDVADGRADADSRQPYDTWGYVTKLGEDATCFDPLAVSASGTEGEAKAIVYLQDTDWNDNGLVDRDEENFEAVDAIFEPEFTAGDFELTDIPEEDKPSATGDVMAYAEVARTLVLVGTDDADAEWYSLPAGYDVAVGDGAETLDGLKTTYVYGGRKSGPYGEGAQVAFTSNAGKKVLAVEDGTVVLVHAQVYSEFGFDPATANRTLDATERVNSKLFTAIDKAYVVRYLKAVGAIEADADETAWTLDRNNPDTDRDGMPDGWELYTMFGPDGVSFNMTISPWNADDRKGDPDEDSLENVDEYDCGMLPTDPWNGDTDGDGIPDNFAFRYHLKGNQFDSDPDRDGLSNYQEYLISEVYNDSLELDPDFKLDPDNAHSRGQAVSDYFLRYNKLYYGELFADHDHIDDMWEDAQPVVTTRGGTVLANYSRFVYDANRDVLGHGWDNWALSRAWFDGVYVTNIIAEATNSADGTVMVTTNSVLTSTFVDNGGNPSPKIPLSVTYHGKGGNFFGETTKYQVVIKAWNLDRRADSEVLGKPDKIWSSTITSPAYLEIDGFASGYSSETGSVKPGRNMFVAYVAEGEAEEGVAAPSYVAGMPFGVVTDVEVGPIGCENVNIEMTDTNASMPRIDIVNALKLQDVYAQAAGAGEEDALTLYKEVAEKYTDRGRWGAYDQLRKSVYVGLDTRGASTNEINKVRVRILRSSVNSEVFIDKVNFSSSEPVLDTVLPVGVQDMITEADLFADYSYADLDWGAVRKICEDNDDKMEFSWGDISNVCYRIVLFDGTVDRANQTNNNLCVKFVNMFEPGIRPTQVTNMEVRTYSGQPTFSWTHDNTIGKAYPAFQLRVWEEDGTTLVFDSGVQRAPTRDAADRYNWTAPLWVGSMTDKDIVFEPNKEYLWSVSMLDAKFTKPVGETKVKFMMQETSPSGGSSDYGIIPVKVKYLGPGEVSTDKHVKCLRVEAFTSPDFIGLPAGAGYVYDDSELATIDGISVNAKIAGLPANRDYYVRAYIDTDGNGVHDAWESWGYACYRGSTVRLDQYEPRAFSPGNAAQANDCEVYVEDADTNCNMVPDVLEYQMEGDGKQVSLSPYIAYSASDASKKAAINNAKSGDSGNKKTLKSAPKQYAYAVSRAAISNGSVTPGLLAVATGGVNYESTDSTHIKIKSFSLEEGISLEVVVDEDYQVVSYGYDTGTIKVGVEYATTLENGGDWQSAGEPDSISFPLEAGTTEIGAESLSAIKAAIEKIESKVAGAAYFRVKAVAIE